MTTATAPDLRVLRDTALAARLLDPERIRLVEALRQVPDSAAGLARRLGEKRQRLNYHLRQLEEAGVLEEVPGPRPGRQRVLRVTARHFVVDPGALGTLAADPATTGDRFSSTYLLALAARTLREVAALQDRAEAAGERLATGSLDVEVGLASPEAFRAFMADLGEAVAGVVARHHTGQEGSRAFRLTAGAHPAPAGTTTTNIEGEDDDDDDRH